MNQASLEAALADLPLGPIRYYDSIGSTNEAARAWAGLGAPDLSLIVADEQTAGKGRARRSWQTPAQTALAFSLILRPPSGKLTEGLSTHLSGACGLAVSSSINKMFTLESEIKWPNDVLIGGKKVCGILIESDWSGDRQLAIVAGIGVNIFKESVPPPAELRSPGTSLEHELGYKPERLSILAEILQAFITWRQSTPQEVIAAWQKVLAYDGRLVQVSPEDGPPYQGMVAGLDENGFLRVRLRSGETVKLASANLSIRLVDSPPE
ncbi:MAG: biotin--[acetyl-CoA-carboxylase] ligase [Anaerolineales bacterium]|nr:biotin--[acetyl-CoA-carboxylase] ligase [Anaerolineales bacterium]